VGRLGRERQREVQYRVFAFVFDSRFRRDDGRWFFGGHECTPSPLAPVASFIWTVALACSGRARRLVRTRWGIEAGAPTVGLCAAPRCACAADAADAEAPPRARPAPPHAPPAPPRPTVVVDTSLVRQLAPDLGPGGRCWRGLRRNFSEVCSPQEGPPRGFWTAHSRSTTSPLSPPFPPSLTHTTNNTITHPPATGSPRHPRIHSETQQTSRNKMRVAFLKFAMGVPSARYPLVPRARPPSAPPALPAAGCANPCFCKGPLHALAQRALHAAARAREKKGSEKKALQLLGASCTSGLLLPRPPLRAPCAPPSARRPLQPLARGLLVVRGNRGRARDGRSQAHARAQGVGRQQQKLPRGCGCRCARARARRGASHRPRPDLPRPCPHPS
jgi:hypothetical protein